MAVSPGPGKLPERQWPTVEACAVACPVCSGPLIHLRGFSRCGRCHFTVCEGCEPAHPGNPAGPPELFED